MTYRHEWKLVGPWYRWHDPLPVHAPAPQPDDDHVADPTLGRASRPILQKYSSSRFVDSFLEEPQLSLRYVAGEDQVAALGGGSAIRKIYLQTHSRFYLVVCELHCEQPGFPNVQRDYVCEAGFVVRRRVANMTPEVRRQADALLRRLAVLQPKMERMSRAGIRRLAQTTEDVKGSAAAARIADAGMDSLRHRRDQEWAKLTALVAKHRISFSLQGWIPEGDTGRWDGVDDCPQEVREDVLPLYPLIPDPNAPLHSAHGRSIYFGVLPTGNSDVDQRGNPRFDDRHLYEVRCYVRRHKPRCPRSVTGQDCHGELVWSPPTEPYQLASQQDLAGTSNRPVTIQLPDLSALKAQANSLNLGEGIGVRMVAPPDSDLSFGTDAGGTLTGGLGGASICSFSIPLITIVATFVLRLFLPVVVFLFQLWFLLRLKFCIPPQLSMDVGLDAAIRASLESPDFEASFEAAVNGSGFRLGDRSINSLNDFKTAMKATLIQRTLEDSEQQLPDLRELAERARDMATDFSADAPPDLAAHFDPLPPGSAAITGSLPSLTDRIIPYRAVRLPKK